MATQRTPPQPPPRVRRDGGGGMTMAGGMTPEDITRLSTSRPLSPLGADEEKVDEDYRTELFDRLQQFYLVYESERVGQGIGHIVDWAMVHGEDELNDRLYEKYGEGLPEFEERMLSELLAAEAAAKASGIPAGMHNLPESFMGQPQSAGAHGEGESVYSTGSTMSSQASSPASLRERLLAFYAKYDTSRLQRGVEDLVEYVGKKGLGSLNSKLLQKYGVTLQDFERGIERAPPSVGGSAGSSAGAAPTRISIRSLLRRSYRQRQERAAPGQVPPFVRPLLELFYSKYDQRKINTGGVEAIYRWTRKHGLAALNHQLKTKYLEDLTEFADRMNKLRDDLEAFYSEHDPSKLHNGGIDAILRWGIRNGRAAINKQLRKKYRCDLENDGADYAEDPDF